MRFAALEADHDPAVAAAIRRVLRRGRYLDGPEVAAFEKAFAAFLGASEAVATGSGTDAITLALAALGVGPGDRVLTSAFGSGYTAVAIRRAGAAPVFGDVEPDTLCLGEAAISAALEAGPVAAVVPVHLYGGAARSWERLLSVAAAAGVPVVEDACQAHGGERGGRRLGSFGAAAAFSFYPTKNLGGLGDSGMVATSDRELAERLRRLRSGGRTGRDSFTLDGWNSRMDEIQAAVLSERLPDLPAAVRRRRALADRYLALLAGAPLTAVGSAGDAEDAGHARHLFVIRTGARDRLRDALRRRGVETLVHYSETLPRQPAFSGAVADHHAFPEADAGAAEVLSLPLHPRLSDRDAERVATLVRDGLRPGRMSE